MKNCVALFLCYVCFVSMIAFKDAKKANLREPNELIVNPYSFNYKDVKYDGLTNKKYNEMKIEPVKEVKKASLSDESEKMKEGENKLKISIPHASASVEIYKYDKKEEKEEKKEEKKNTDK